MNSALLDFLGTPSVHILLLVFAVASDASNGQSIFGDGSSAHLQHNEE